MRRVLHPSSAPLRGLLSTLARTPSSNAFALNRSIVGPLASRLYSTVTNAKSNIVGEPEYVPSPTFVLNNTPMPCYRIMDQTGTILPGAQDPEVIPVSPVRLFNITH